MAEDERVLLAGVGLALGGACGEPLPCCGGGSECAVAGAACAVAAGGGGRCAADFKSSQGGVSVRKPLLTAICREKIENYAHAHAHVYDT